MNSPVAFRARKTARVKLAALAGLSLALASFAGTAPAQAWEMRVCADFNRMPFSNRDQEGFENRIAEILADEMGATLVFEWWPQRDVMVNNALRPGDCDVVIGAAEGQAGLLTTLAYYRSPFVFVYRADAGYDITTFDDPVLQDLRLGVSPYLGPTQEAFMRHGLGDNIDGEYDYAAGTEAPLAPPVEAVANGDVDVVAMWGPAAGYYAAQQDVPLVVQPVPTFEPPFIPMFVNISVGVRQGDDELRDLLNVAITNRWDDINAVLAEYNVPTMPLPKPITTLELPQ
jgi:mxaJ protein